MAGRKKGATLALYWGEKFMDPPRLRAAVLTQAWAEYDLYRGRPWREVDERWMARLLFGEENTLLEERCKPVAEALCELARQVLELRPELERSPLRGDSAGVLLFRLGRAATSELEDLADNPPGTFALSARPLETRARMVALLDGKVWDPQKRRRRRMTDREIAIVSLLLMNWPPIHPGRLRQVGYTVAQVIAAEELLVTRVRERARARAAALIKELSKKPDSPS